MRPFRLALVAVILIALVIWVVIPQVSAAVTRTWNQSDSSTALSGCLDENYNSVVCPNFNLTEPWSQMGRVTIDGQTMVYVPKFWYRTDNVTINGFHYMNFSVSSVPLTGYSVEPWFIVNQTTVPYLYIGAFEGSVQFANGIQNTGDFGGVNVATDRLVSVSGVKPASGANNSITLPNFRTMAQKGGVGWELQSFNGVSAVQLLYIVEYGNWDSQSVIGAGVTNLASGTGNKAVNTGSTSTLGNATGNSSVLHSSGVWTYPISYRGIENFYGNIWKWVDGINLKSDRNPWIANYGFASNTFALPYVNTALTLPSSNGYVSDLTYSSGFDYGFLPSGVAGASSTYITDYYNQATGTRAAMLGDSWNGNTAAGAFTWLVDLAASIAGPNVGARLAFTPTVVANFTYTNTSAAFIFDDESFTISTLTGLTGSPSSWNWSFGDGAYSAVANPTHEYTSLGTYSVTLTVSDGTYYGTYSDNIVVDVCPTVAMIVPASPQVRIMPAYMKWNQTSTNGPVSCLWQFGDGTSSTVCNVSHKYPLPGEYPVQFTATNAAGSSTNTTRIRVMMR